MQSVFGRSVLRPLLGAVVGCFMFASTGYAALTSAQLQSAEQQMLANPAQFLATNFASGGDDLAAVVKALAADPANLQTLINVLANANPSQQQSIGFGLAQAAQLALQNNPQYANQIQVAVAAANSPQASAGYQAGSGGTQIGSTGGAGGGGGGGGGVGGGGGINNGPPGGGGNGGGNGPNNGGGNQQANNGNGNGGGGGGVGSSGGGNGSVSSH